VTNFFIEERGLSPLRNSAMPMTYSFAVKLSRRTLVVLKFIFSAIFFITFMRREVSVLS
jgi:hypothetical protein